MSVTRQELAAFHRFADARLAHGEEASLAELVAKWEADREVRQTTAEIRESLADHEGGRVKPLADAFADVRKKLGFDE